MPLVVLQLIFRALGYSAASLLAFSHVLRLSARSRESNTSNSECADSHIETPDRTPSPLSRAMDQQTPQQR